MEFLNPIVNQGSTKEKGKETQVKKVWKPKESVKFLLDHVSIRGSSRYDWCFDGGCSQHMTYEKSYIEGLKTYSQSYATFGNGTRKKSKA